MSLVGYARVSSKTQNLECQIEILKDFGCTEIFYEKESGLEGCREELKSCLRYLRKNETLVVTRLDRLARSTLHLCQIAETLRIRDISLVVTEQKIDTSTATGKLLFHVLASIAEFETAIRAERQAEGIAKAQANGVKFGAKPKITPKQVSDMKLKRANGVMIKDLVAEFGISKATVYRLLDGTSSNQDSVLDDPIIIKDPQLTESEIEKITHK